MPPESLTKRIKAEASRLGFALCGICPAVAPLNLSKFDEWLAAGFAGQMRYLSDRREAYDHPRHVLDGVRSIVMLALPYATIAPNHIAEGCGRVSRYAWGEKDYHDIIRDRLKSLSKVMKKHNSAVRTRGVVDTAPLLEREFAQLAGLGWIGKNTLLLSKEAGSYFFLAAMLTDVELDYDMPHETDHCGTCTACLDSCPTDAFAEPYVLDATKCISYLTIELQDVVPPDLRAGMGDWVFGCDVCQDVCPWNHDSQRSTEETFAPQEQMNPLSLVGLFNLDDNAFRQRFGPTPLWRSHRRGLLRNAAIVLGNQRFAGATDALGKGLNDEESLVRGAAAWALGMIATASAQQRLSSRQALESDHQVLEEIQAALELC